MERSCGFPSNFASKLPTKNGVASKFGANVSLCSIRKKHFLPKMELLQSFVQTFTCVVYEINFLPKMELLQNFVQMFPCVV
jgi:hypothetical protein